MSLKSAWAYNNGKRMMKEALDSQKSEKISFIDKRRGKLYAKYGNIKTYCNKKQADNKVVELKDIGYNVGRSFDHPFVIRLIEN